MIETNRIGSGTSKNIEIVYNEIDETKRWFDRRFYCIFLLTAFIITLAIIMMILIVILIIKLNSVDSLAQVQSKEIANGLKEQLQESINKFKQPFSLGIPGIPPPTGSNPIYPKVFGPDALRRSPKPRYEWKGCSNKCSIEFGHDMKPPLVLISFDGFAREYLDRKIVQALDHIAECGVKGERVYPSYPSKTFPNHYSIVTGLFPESHGITDNNVYDSRLSDKLESMKKTTIAEFFRGEPIWSVFKRVANGKAFCLFWVGCVYNSTGYPPDIAPPYNQSFKFKDRVDKLIQWLQLPSDERPGLITAYLHEPDGAGHMQNNDDDVNAMLVEVDNLIDYLMTRLKDTGLLECVNLVILSDHGMQKVQRRYYMNELLSTKGIYTANGVVGRLYLHENDTNVDDIANQLQCKLDEVKVYKRSEIPVRKHYSFDQRVGDLILEGPLGTTFYSSKDRDNLVKADHGYDYLHPNMHTIFFARGPSFRKNVTVRPFQNIQYMNLWMALLGIEGSVETNGTIGFFDDILIETPLREKTFKPIRECPIKAFPSALDCTGNPSLDQLTSLSAKLSMCSFIPQQIPFESDNHCFQNYCDKKIFRTNLARTATIFEPLTYSNKNEEDFTYFNGKYFEKCPNVDEMNSTISVGSLLATTYFNFPTDFTRLIFDPLQAKTLEYLKRFNQLVVFSGLASDSNHDGIEDENSEIATHFYRIIFRCDSGWISQEVLNCLDLKSIAFIFPIDEHQKFLECMDQETIFREYMATIWDVERISGFRLSIPTRSHNENVKIRTEINTRLW